MGGGGSPGGKGVLLVRPKANGGRGLIWRPGGWGATPGFFLRPGWAGAPSYGLTHVVLVVASCTPYPSKPTPGGPRAGASANQLPPSCPTGDLGSRPPNAPLACSTHTGHWPKGHWGLAGGQPAGYLGAKAPHHWGLLGAGWQVGQAGTGSTSCPCPCPCPGYPWGLCQQAGQGRLGQAKVQ